VSIIFVFGSNLAGIHGAGAAKTARMMYGAELKVGVGLTGKSYAIPTKDTHLRTLDLEMIRGYVKSFKDFARAHPNMNFLVTRIGCGLAGYTDAEIAPMFRGASANCFFSPLWARYLHD
jgi:hypothetical protein